MAASDTLDRSFTITRVVDAPRELVFAAWTQPDELVWFFSDPAADNPPIEVDLRVGGEWRQLMVIDETTSYITGGIYREIVPAEKLSFSWGARDGWPELDPAQPNDGPLATVTLNGLGDTTEMVFLLELSLGLTDDQVQEQLATGMMQGWSQTLDRLVTHFSAAAN